MLFWCSKSAGAVHKEKQVLAGPFTYTCLCMIEGTELIWPSIVQLSCFSECWFLYVKASVSIFVL